MFNVVLLISGTTAVASLHAQMFLSPVSYSATPGSGITHGGQYDYFDDTGNQLTDGVYGSALWFADLGKGAAYEWVAWIPVSPSITFNFSGPTTVNKVTIGFNVGNGGVKLPNTVVIGGTSFDLNGDEVAYGSRGDLAFTGSWTGPSLTVDLVHDVGTSWIFVDEFAFQSVPEPTTCAVVTGTCLLTFAAWRRRANRASTGTMQQE